MMIALDGTNNLSWFIFMVELKQRLYQVNINFSAILLIIQYAASITCTDIKVVVYLI